MLTEDTRGISCQHNVRLSPCFLFGPAEDGIRLAVREADTESAAGSENGLPVTFDLRYMEGSGSLPEKIPRDVPENRKSSKGRIAGS